ncbi:hypothetical protein GCM10011505_45180 [Tistrella bauzanensis]|uniref:DUF2239 domain-containing protein n=1 Tax=Tistrella bauzanensis TaxID=657419 RepID=A0ABQ1J7I1_9PROT|nr:DUF2239 family protein [Tistrella bauzanensis]GGB59377.1 hypothetical protein GCM10011505_45180 [Tistrella bauzanensis]
MTDRIQRPSTAFDGAQRLAAGPLIEVALTVKAAVDAGAAGPLLIFDDATGRVVDVDLRGTRTEIAARLADPTPTETMAPPPPPPAATRGRGRPKLGVVGREVTLLPRHWDWLAAQPGGASVALRKLVEAARRDAGPDQRLRMARETAYRFMNAMAGDLSGYEEATRALFAGDRSGFEAQIADWPADIAAHARQLAFGAAP